MKTKILFTVFFECCDSIIFSLTQLVPSINAKFTTNLGKKIFCIQQGHNFSFHFSFEHS